MIINDHPRTGSLIYLILIPREIAIAALIHVWHPKRFALSVQVDSLLRVSLL